MGSNNMNKMYLKLEIKQNADNTFNYQYYSVLESGVVVKVEGFIINQPTQFEIELSNKTKASYTIKECLVPGNQDVVTVEKLKKFSVTLIDKDNELEPEDYNFIIIATSNETGAQIVCDPQIINRGGMPPI